ncbi:hypothetical protein AVEN_2906-1 [Araneus ventricosus]|uniref:Histone-lysine N-methyltransferase SETMAR n=1 Tax=Araneus ventricosus TaxID=182803 RepID=A0A4Y2KEW8_ARAVE|nr:hypothetical protein AVEN_2906-1 [Araneus ventricosus]
METDALFSNIPEYRKHMKQEKQFFYKLATQADNESQIITAQAVTNSATISAVDELIRQNRRVTTREIDVELSISKGTVHHIIQKKLGNEKVCAQWVPKNLSENQKMSRLGVCLTQQFLH